MHPPLRIAADYRTRGSEQIMSGIVSVAKPQQLALILFGNFAAEHVRSLIALMTTPPASQQKWAANGSDGSGVHRRSALLPSAEVVVANLAAIGAVCWKTTADHICVAGQLYSRGIRKTT